MTRAVRKSRAASALSVSLMFFICFSFGGRSPPLIYFDSAKDSKYSLLAQALPVHSACSQQVNVLAGNSDKALFLSITQRPFFVLLTLTVCAQGFLLTSDV